MSGINIGILQNAYPLSAEAIKELEKQVLENKEAFVYLDENSQLCFSMSQEVNSIKDLAWHNAYELSAENNSFIKKAYKKTGLKTYSLDKVLEKNNIEDPWREPSTPEEERLEGDGQEFYTAAPSTLSFRSTAPLNELQDVQINGQTVDPSNYTLEEGSTIVKLKHDYLSTLNVGKYELSVISDSKTVKGDFTVTAPKLNEYGFYYDQPYSIEVPLDEDGNMLTMLAIFNDPIGIGGIDESLYTSCGYLSDASGQRIPFTYSVDGSTITTYSGEQNDQLLFEIHPDGLFLDGYGKFTLGSDLCKSDGHNLYMFNGESFAVGHITAMEAISYSPIKSSIADIPVTNIADYGYLGVTTSDMNTLVIPEGVTHIGKEAFADSSVRDIYFPSTLLSIGSSVFLDCYLNSITFAGTCDEWKVIEGHGELSMSGVSYIQCSDGQVAL